MTILVQPPTVKVTTLHHNRLTQNQSNLRRSPNSFNIAGSGLNSFTGYQKTKVHVLIIFVQSVLAPMTKVDPYLSSTATSHHVSILAIFAQFRLWLLPCLRQRVFSTSSQFSSLDSFNRDKRPLSRPNLSHNAFVSHDPNSIILDLTGPDSEAGWSAGDTLLSYQLSTVSNSAQQS